jgi:predicted MPP superfamily phosphohydrolase
VKIHLLSDLHLERGPYTLPPDLDFDVLVAAGDISDDPAQAIDFLKSIGKPVIMVLGNHDYWSGRLHGLFGPSDDSGSVDMADRLAEFKRLASGTNVHVLEQESAVLKIRGKRVRFLGATLWTSYGNGNKALMEIGSRTMNDTVMIGVGSWIDASKKNAKAYQAGRKSTALFYDPSKSRRRFEPPVALDIHRQTVAWLERQLKRHGNWDSTVIVSHHWPSWDALVTVGKVRKPELALDPQYWARHTHRPDREEHGVSRLASYGSPMEKFIERYRERIDLWCCGHVHESIDVGLHGVRLASNARGYTYDEDGSNRGDGWGTFDERKIIDLADGVMPALLPVIDAAAKEIDALIDEMGLLAKYVHDESDSYQCEIMRTAFDDRCHEINQVIEKITGHVNSNLEARGNFGLHHVIAPAHIYASWRDPFESVRGDDFPAPTTDPAEQAILSATRFLHRLRNVHRKPKQFHRVQDYLVAKAVRRLEAHGVRVEVEQARSRFTDDSAFIRIEDANGLDRDAMEQVINPLTSPGRRYHRSLFVLVGA